MDKLIKAMKEARKANLSVQERAPDGSLLPRRLDGRTWSQAIAEAEAKRKAEGRELEPEEETTPLVITAGPSGPVNVPAFTIPGVSADAGYSLDAQSRHALPRPGRVRIRYESVAHLPVVPRPL